MVKKHSLILGIKAIAEKFAEDDKGHFGCKKANEETKKKIVTELMKEDKLGIAVRKAVRQLNNKGGIQREIIQTFISKGVMLAIGGVIGYMLKASMNDFEKEL